MHQQFNSYLGMEPVIYQPSKSKWRVIVLVFAILAMAVVLYILNTQMMREQNAPETLAKVLEENEVMTQSALSV